MKGCSYTASVTSPVFTSSIAIARVAIVCSSGLQAIEFGVPLILPVADSLQYMAHFEVREVLCLLIADLGRNTETEWSAVLAAERLAIHFVTQQRLRVQGGSHVEGLVIVIRTFDAHEACGWVSANHLEEVGEEHATEVANHVPPFDAHMARVLRHLGQCLNLSQRVVSRLLHRARHGEGPLVKIDVWVVDVVVVDGELLKGGQIGGRKRRRQMTGAEQPCRYPIAKGETALEEWFLDLRDGKGTQREYRGK